MAAATVLCLSTLDHLANIAKKAGKAKTAAIKAFSLQVFNQPDRLSDIVEGLIELPNGLSLARAMAKTMRKHVENLSPAGFDPVSFTILDVKDKVISIRNVDAVIIAEEDHAAWLASTAGQLATLRASLRNESEATGPAEASAA